MFTRRELENAIAECEKNPSTFNDCQKLAAFYTLYDHLYTDNEPREQRTVYTETIIDNYGDSEFFMAVQGRDSESVWEVLNELMSALQIVNPKLYNATLQKIDSL